ncbi:hypothetical protein BOTBODRAFT_182387 [Botryobasidium botryosum FD-172 SS1]|uniref:CCHC-type domain-containing protein n=1 Tax=Botryobasidium botryosum (strain FD-172 SS1) TaxID=930990 RepID=A0A067LRG5_BOTB1|nr:hypothetical protein BOTBODRAFT_182387 [Botryobasidium botryosum FD-172 SS1]
MSLPQGLVPKYLLPSKKGSFDDGARCNAFNWFIKFDNGKSAPEVSCLNKFNIFLSTVVFANAPTLTPIYGYELTDENTVGAPTEIVNFVPWVQFADVAPSSFHRLKVKDGKIVPSQQRQARSQAPTPSQKPAYLAASSFSPPPVSQLIDTESTRLLRARAAAKAQPPPTFEQVYRRDAGLDKQPTRSPTHDSVQARIDEDNFLNDPLYEPPVHSDDNMYGYEGPADDDLGASVARESLQIPAPCTPPRPIRALSRNRDPDSTPRIVRDSPAVMTHALSSRASSRASLHPYNAENRPAPKVNTDGLMKVDIPTGMVAAKSTIYPGLDVFAAAPTLEQSAPAQETSPSPAPLENPLLGMWRCGGDGIPVFVPKGDPTVGPTVQLWQTAELAKQAYNETLPLNVDEGNSSGYNNPEVPQSGNPADAQASVVPEGKGKAMVRGNPSEAQPSEVPGDKPSKAQAMEVPKSYADARIELGLRTEEFPVPWQRIEYLQQYIAAYKMEFPEAQTPPANLWSEQVMQAEVNGPVTTSDPEMDAEMSEALKLLIGTLSTHPDASSVWSAGTKALICNLATKIMSADDLVSYMLLNRNITDAIDRKRKFTVPTSVHMPQRAPARAGKDFLHGDGVQHPLYNVDNFPRPPIRAPAPTIAQAGKSHPALPSKPQPQKKGTEAITKPMTPETAAAVAILSDKARAAGFPPVPANLLPPKPKSDAQAGPSGPKPRYSDLLKSTTGAPAPAVIANARVQGPGKAAQAAAPAQPPAPVAPAVVPRHIAAKIIRTPGTYVRNLANKPKGRRQARNEHTFVAFNHYVPVDERIPNLQLVGRFNEEVENALDDAHHDKMVWHSMSEVEKKAVIGSYHIEAASWGTRGGLHLYTSSHPVAMAQQPSDFADTAIATLYKIFGFYFSQPNDGAKTYPVTIKKMRMRQQKGDEPVSKAMILNELTTHLEISPNLVDVNKSRWLIPAERRDEAITGTFCVEVKSEMVRDMIVNAKFVTVHGTRYWVNKWNEEKTAFRQCTRCYGIGHMQADCKSARPVCALCGRAHYRFDHVCPTAGCGVRGRACEHVKPKCINCGGPHSADNQRCVSNIVIQLAGPKAVSEAREALKW